MSENNGEEFIPINRAAMVQGASVTDSQSVHSQQTAVISDTSGSAGILVGNSAQSGNASSGAEQTRFASELPSWDLLPPPMPIKRVKRQL